MTARSNTQPQIDPIYSGLANRANTYDLQNGDEGSLHKRLGSLHRERACNQRSRTLRRAHEAIRTNGDTSEHGRSYTRARRVDTDCTRTPDLKSNAGLDSRWVDVAKAAGTLGLGGALSVLAGNPAPLAVAATNVGAKVIDRGLTL